MVCLPLDRVNFWLATVDVGRIKNPHAQSKVVLYQEECAEALYRHFHGVRQPVGVPPLSGLSDQQARVLGELLRLGERRDDPLVAEAQAGGPAALLAMSPLRSGLSPHKTLRIMLQLRDSGMIRNGDEVLRDLIRLRGGGL